MAYLPICLDLTDKKCVVFGGGSVATRKTQTLLDACARVIVVAPSLSQELMDLHGHGVFEHAARGYQQGDLVGAALAIAATGDHATNLAIAAEGRDAAVLVNIVDDPANCDFVLPAILHRGDLMLAVSTNGRSPAVARWMRDRLKTMVTQDYATLLDVVAEVRQTLRSRGVSVPAERWQAVLSDDLLELVRQGEAAKVREGLLELLGHQ